MIYLAGDTHGRMDIAKLSPAKWPEGQTLTRDDYLIILGDFGAIWGDGSGELQLSNADRELLLWWESQPWTTLFVDGNHENHDLIDTFEVSERFGGAVQVVPGFPHVVHLMRGEAYDLPFQEGVTARCFVMGGADSMDKQWRTEGVNWWARELPSQEEYERATASLERIGWSVDYVLTHDVPYNAMAEALGQRWSTQWGDPPFNQLVGFLRLVDEKLDKQRLKMWYAGHYHVDRMVLDDQHCVLYHTIVKLGEGVDQRDRS